MRLSLQFDTPDDPIKLSDLRELKFSIPKLLGAVLTVAVLKVARSRDGRLERCLSTGLMTDQTGRVTHTFRPCFHGEFDSDALVNMAGRICQVAEDRAWSLDWPWRLFFEFEPLATTRWLASRSRALSIETVVRLPDEVNERAVPLVTNIVERVWPWGVGMEQSPEEIESEKRARIGEALNWGQTHWHDRRGIEGGVAHTVLQLDPVCGFGDLGNRRETMFLKLVHAAAGPENEFPPPDADPA